ncbi:rhomboid family intramembrane serine protease [Rhodopirellula sp. JC740]|uniref:Rhomboid family intramembrane serine protease n=1 Tax=Rhodopirellula halodulae TaxID=2894198 RepID=A0ABS8ND40_9BACT|nr:MULTISPECIES: rhomboid family intramembrane serine protease [unclassified Rhodopirellula]MCC9641468.1 rhomboid family intramembrane serine protease [Rhodopirellula sp. JC740]MCC9657876.1 rhomboid family intramembrane serine protease [Rhodopirellula sp. JC737]
MGLNERDYSRSERTPWDRIENPLSMIKVLIGINVAVFLVDLVMDDQLSTWFAVGGDSLTRPWMWFRTLTYGFLHNTHVVLHILFNMFLLFIFGRPVEQRLGGPEFLRFYLLAIIAGGFVAMIYPWAVSLLTTGQIVPEMIGIPTIGASGAVVAVTILFACYFPQQEILFMFVLPMKAWVLAVLLVVGDLMGALGFFGGSDPTAFEVHLAGAVFGFLYAQLGWSFGWLDFTRWADLPSRLRQKSRRARLKLHDPDKKIRSEAQEADRILAKIHESGESSLTSSERKTLERYSRRQRQKRDWD